VWYVPQDELVRISILSKRIPATNPQNSNVPKRRISPYMFFIEHIPKKKIEELAIQKYRTRGQGIDFVDVMKFHC